jgi:ribosome-associated protein
MAKTTKTTPTKKIAAPAKKTAVKTSAKAAPKAAKKAPLKKAVKKSPVKTVKKASPAKKVAPIKKEKPVASKKIIKDSTQLLADAVVEGILEIKGKNITVMNLQSIHNRVCDYFIICQADSNTQVNAIAESIQETVKKMTGDKPYRSEGFENSEWILIDYVTVVVHVFQSHIRDFYNLESLWADAETTQIAFE